MDLHIIRFKYKKGRVRSLEAWFEVNRECVSVSDGKGGTLHGVSGAHIRALIRHNIPFEYVSDTAPKACVSYRARCDELVFQVGKESCGTVDY